MLSKPSSVSITSSTKEFHFWPGLESRQPVVAARIAGGQKRQLAEAGSMKVAYFEDQDFETRRYSLGFQIAEGEKVDGRLHNLEVRVKAPDAKGKLRKLQVSSRKGYYMSETGTKDTAALTTP
ncbi:MAG: hypothetical protein M3539_11405 [Acidobacteriota bacterium]|nr:hypothetical protein [Acidobacteriota bacterium]